MFLLLFPCCITTYPLNISINPITFFSATSFDFLPSYLQYVLNSLHWLLTFSHSHLLLYLYLHLAGSYSILSVSKLMLGLILSLFYLLLFIYLQISLLLFTSLVSSIIILFPLLSFSWLSFLASLYPLPLPTSLFSTSCKSF